MSALASFVSGRRTKWVVLALWIVAFMAMSPLGGKLQDETVDDTESFLPDSAESTEVVRTLDDEFDAGETTSGIVVYKREGGLTPADRQRIVDDAENFQLAGQEDLPLTEPPAVPFTDGAPPGSVSDDGEIAFTTLTVPTDFEQSADWGKTVRDVVGEEPVDGLETYVSGDLGFSADAEEVFGELDVKLLLATSILVLILLGAIYRAVLVALTPLLVVFFAY